MGSEKCPLCGSDATEFFRRVRERDYLWCGECDLVFLLPEHCVSFADEKQRYELHRNSREDEGYCTFLSRLTRELFPLLSESAKGLDFGSGPSPVLSELIEDAGYGVRCYDPFFCDDSSVFSESYDFITCVETVEHFRQPGKEFKRLDSLLRDDGVLALMTQLRLPERDFSAWWYVRDSTHVSFYSEQTMRWIAQHFNWGLQMKAQGVCLFGGVS